MLSRPQRLSPGRPISHFRAVQTPAIPTARSRVLCGYMSEKAQSAQRALSDLRTQISDLESVYKDIHAHPELSMQETRTAGIAADRLRAAGYEVTAGVGKTGVVGLLRN